MGAKKVAAFCQLKILTQLCAFLLVLSLKMQKYSIAAIFKQTLQSVSICRALHLP